MKSIVKKNDKKGGVVTATVLGIAGLIIGTIITLVIIQTLTGASLLDTASAEENASTEMVGNFTDGLDEVGDQLPTILLIVAVVFLFGALVLLIGQSKRMGIGGGGGSL